jgi:peptide subunit release factor 1 (eRF1)
VLAQFKDLAPKPLLDHVMGEFTIHMTASPAEILHRSLDIAHQTDLDEERRIVEEAITAAAKGGAGVTGATDTLYALHHGQVRILLAEESFHTPGYICSHCGYLSANAHDECPICKSVEIDETPDVVNIAIHKAIETGAKVNIVRDNAMLQEAGGIAAVLRY